MTPRPPARLLALLMAAGASSRFGGCKLLCAVEGQTLLQRSLSLCSAAQHTYVVLGAHTQALLPHLVQPLQEQEVSALPFDRWQQGLGASIAYGVSQLPEAEGVLILLADQALLSHHDIARLVQTWRSQPEKIACAAYRGSVGVPAIFPQRVWPSLMSLSGDQGAKKLLLNAGHAVKVPLERAGFDLDTLEDWEALGQRPLL